MKKATKILSLLLVLLIIFVSCDVVGLPGEAETDANECTSHADADDNGTCDICAVSVLVNIDFYVINDIHGKFDDTTSNEGVDELTTYLKKMNETDDFTVFLSSGDMWQGSSESNLTKGLIMTDWMNELDFVSMTLGNHEFDWGEEYIEANSQIAEFPFLAINIYDRDTNKRVEYCEPSVVIERGGIQIGIIGAIGDCYSSISADKTTGIYFKTGSDLTSLVKEEAERLRSEGVDYIVYSIHDGFETNKNSDYYASSSDISSYYSPTLSDGYIDPVFEGHTHKKYVLIDQNGVYHMQSGGENQGLSHVEISINSVTGSSRVSDAEFVSSKTYTAFADDPLVDGLLEKYKDHISIADTVLGTIDRKKDDSEIEALVAQLYYEVGFEKWGDEYDIVLGGGFIKTRSPYNLNAGTVIYSDVQALLPFDNEIMLCSIKGRDLLRKFINTDNSDYYVFYGDYGNSIKNNIDSNATYYLICDVYTASYAYNNLTVIDSFGTEVFARDLVAEFIKNGGWTTTK